MADILVARTDDNLPAIIPRFPVRAQTAGQKLKAKAVQVGRQLTNVQTLPTPYVEDKPRAATIACVIPAYNEQDTIESVLKALLSQTRLPDVIHVIVNNTDDDTIENAQPFVGHHYRQVKGVGFTTQVFVHDMGANPDKKVGALNYGYNLCRGFDFILGVDGDTVLDRKAVEWLELEMVDDTRIGGISAIYSTDYDQAKGPFGKFLIAGQRQQFVAFNMDNLLRGRNMAVLGGQCSLFRTEALEAVKREYRQRAPWVRDSEVEDSYLSLQIKKVGFSTKISARARADVGAMTTMSALHAQQVKWNFGTIDLMYPGTRGNTKGQPFHPNLRLRWFENVSMLCNILTRIVFLALLTASLTLHAFVFSPIWLIPPLIAVALNVRIAMAMHHKSPLDMFYAILALPAEAYMWLRMGHFGAAWVQFFARIEKDNWGAQARAEGGSGGAGHLWPIMVMLAALGGAVYGWACQSTNVQLAILSIGWPCLFIFTIIQTMFMLKKVVRRYRGFRV